MIDPELFKKLDDTDIWEFRTFYNKVKYRLLAFGIKITEQIPLLLQHMDL